MDEHNGHDRKNTVVLVALWQAAREKDSLEVEHADLAVMKRVGAIRGRAEVQKVLLALETSGQLKIKRSVEDDQSGLGWVIELCEAKNG